MPYKGEICSADEDVARAVCSNYYDEARDRISPSLFEGRNVSVGRLSVSPLQELIRILKREVAKPNNPLKMVGQINVGLLQKLGRDHKDGRARPVPVEITVVAKPQPGYLAHAEIPRKIPRGLARKIIKELRNHTV